MVSCATIAVLQRTALVGVRHKHRGCWPHRGSDIRNIGNTAMAPLDESERVHARSKLQEVSGQSCHELSKPIEIFYKQPKEVSN